MQAAFIRFCGGAGHVLVVYQVLQMTSHKEIQGGHKSGDLGGRFYDLFFLSGNLRTADPTQHSCTGVA
jgi:hypothetical protein